ncbi:MAG: BglG family transcription antiterminator [Eubacteriales bacterium]
MRLTSLTERQLNILRQLAMADGYLTLSSIANNMDISTRTVVRELEDCEEYIASIGAGIEKRSGHGIRLTADPEVRAKLKALVDNDAAMPVYGTPDRQLFLRQNLLIQDEPVKLFTLSRQMNVAKSTISNDLDRLEVWFQTHCLTLVRKPGLGIYIDGSESDRRRAMSSILHEVWDENSLIELMLSPRDNPQNRKFRALLQLKATDIDALQQLIQVVEIWEKQHQLPHIERSFLSLVLTLVILIQRTFHPYLDIKEPTHFSKQILQLADSLITDTESVIKRRIPDVEMYYIAEQLSVLYPDIPVFSNTMVPSVPVIDAKVLARQIISLLQRDTGYALIEEESLAQALAKHLQPAIQRLQHHEAIHNPLEKEIREHYPQWFKLARRYSVLVESALNISVPDSEVAYLTLYLGAAMEKAAARAARKYTIAVLCPIGMSSSVLLASRVESLFPNISVAALISLSEAPEIIRQQKFDMILSTADITLPGIPVLTVRPFLPDADQEKIRQFLKTLTHRKYVEPIVISESYLRQLRRMNELIDGLSSVLSNFFCLSTSIDTLPEIIAFAAEQVDPEQAAAISREMERRESWGHVVVAEHNLALLHTRTDLVTNLHFGVIRLDKSVEIDGVPVEICLIMVAPFTISEEKLEIMRLISQSIVEEESFVPVLKNESPQTVYQYLENILKMHFQLNVQTKDF